MVMVVAAVTGPPLVEVTSPGLPPVSVVSVSEDLVGVSIITVSGCPDSPGIVIVVAAVTDPPRVDVTSTGPSPVAVDSSPSEAVVGVSMITVSG
jgi:hypothetical protein